MVAGKYNFLSLVTITLVTRKKKKWFFFSVLTTPFYSKKLTLLKQVSLKVIWFLKHE